MEQDLVNTIIEDVATVLDAELTELPPLAHSIDPDALMTLAEPDSTVSSISFRYADCDITIDLSDDHQVTIRPLVL